MEDITIWYSKNLNTKFGVGRIEINIQGLVFKIIINNL